MGFLTTYWSVNFIFNLLNKKIKSDYLIFPFYLSLMFGNEFLKCSVMGPSICYKFLFIFEFYSKNGELKSLVTVGSGSPNSTL